MDIDITAPKQQAVVIEVRRGPAGPAGADGAPGPAGADGADFPDHGGLTGLADDDHPQYINHSLATAANDFLVASGAGVYVKKTLAETKTILGVGTGGIDFLVAQVFS